MSEITDDYSPLCDFVSEEIEVLAEMLAMKTHKTELEIRKELIKLIDNLDNQ